ncbi:serine hydrolase [Bradyrhizobium sp. Ce-3]|uniref:serine hydrolase n=1 Tax=Bradyrhizobium sp. Ce-3 TaxID=2913970 RepID=UPI001FC8D83E|nr:serine hydrolase [Bradyrhizobium sp. Ce-3]GKQ52275.1 serine hydrolase [Bradyrhizobium sp. Ce-3]
MKQWFPIRFASILLAVAVSALAGARADSDMDAQIRDIVTTELVPTATASDPGGLAAAVYAGGRVAFFNYGFADSAAKRPITSDTLFNLASLRKLFEATLVALGTERGELQPDDPVSKYLPELNGGYVSRVTIGELVNHTSGLLLPTDHPPWPNESFSRDQFIAMLNAWTPLNGEQPGKQRIYSHAGYVLLQLVLEQRYRMPIATLIEGRILKPLGMTSTFLPDRGEDNRASMAPEFMPRMVQGYAHDGTPIGPPGNQQSYYDFPGTGQMFSSARDLGILLRACLDGAVIDPELRAALQMTERESFRVDAKFGQAMAWEHVRLDGVTVVDKPGGLNNASAYIGLVPARRFGIVLLANRGDYPHEIARYRILPALARL